jgi:1,2-diacylglycerol 3-alpha-glucosyltransferase
MNMSKSHASPVNAKPRQTAVAVIWIDWYPYHVARFIGLKSACEFAGKVIGIELVGGIGVHAGLKFREDLPDGLPVLTLMPDSSWKNAGQFRLARKLWTTLGQVDPGIVLVPGYYTLPAIAAAVWAKIHRRQSVLMTESTASDHVRVWWKEKLKALLIRTLFDWAIAGGTAHRRYLEGLGFPLNRVMRFYDIVDNDFFRSRTSELRQRDASEFGLPPGYFLYVGRLSEEKNVDGLLAEWTRYREAGGSWPLVVVGDGPASRDLRQQASQSAFAGDVHFAGHQGLRELPTFYAFARCFVLPSTREPWGLVVNESMASGLPAIVSSRCGCSEDLIDPGKNGYIFNPSIPGELAQCLRRMEDTVPSELVRTGARSSEIIGRYSPTAFGEEIAVLANITSVASLERCSLPG